MSSQQKGGVIPFLFENSIFLIAGAIGALVWANVDNAGYESFIHHDLTGGDQHADSGGVDQTNDHSSKTTATAPDQGENTDHAQEQKPKHHGLTLHFLINDILMALFFAIAGKEVWEALLPGGALSDPKKAATPLLATLGGIVGPAGLYMAGVLTFDAPNLADGWAIPCATDIAFSYLVARIIFGPGHPAIAFLLLLAIADDAAGLAILAVFYPQKELKLVWLLLSVAAVGLGFAFRKLKLQSFWWWLLICGSMSWYGFEMAGIHAALGLVPIIPCMPHAHTDLGIFAREELQRDDTLNAFEHWWKKPVEIILGFFGLMNAGVAFTSVGLGTWLVLVGLLIGKPLGITVFTWISQKVFRLQIPGGMNYRDVVTLGTIAGIGFTVALFVSTAAFKVPDNPKHPDYASAKATLDSAKMGALGSFFAAALSFGVARKLGVKPLPPEDAAAS
ncbi:MAG: Na+/H+ antiporter NhaA [Planctomycetota bacterium]|nr:Na+/H+ antiporter NhaA [Planctomycetota bacterium]